MRAQGDTGLSVRQRGKRARSWRNCKVRKKIAVGVKEGEATADVLKGENRNEARCQNDFWTGSEKR